MNKLHQMKHTALIVGAAGLLFTCKQVDEDQQHDLQAIHHLQANAEVQAPLCGVATLADKPDGNTQRRLTLINEWLSTEGVLNEQAMSHRDIITKVLVNAPTNLISALKGFGTSFSIVDSTPSECSTASWSEEDAAFAEGASVDATETCFFAKDDMAPTIYFVAKPEDQIELERFGPQVLEVFGASMPTREFLIRTQLIRMSSLVYARYIIGSRALTWINQATKNIENNAALQLTKVENDQASKDLDELQAQLKSFFDSKHELMQLLIGDDKSAEGEISELSARYKSLKDSVDSGVLADYIYAEAVDSFYCNDYTKHEFIQGFPKSSDYFVRVFKPELDWEHMN